MRIPHAYPIIGAWYQDTEQQARFEVVAQDKASGTIDIQYFTGEIEEIDVDTWFAMQIIPIAVPYDWTGPFEVDKEQE